MVHSPEELLERAQRCLEVFPPQKEAARKFLEKCLEQHPNNCDALDAFADFLLRFSPSESSVAQSFLEKAVALEPDACAPLRFLSLAQLAESDKSLELYSKGLQLLQRELQQLNDESVNRDAEVHAVWRQISSVKCSIAELYMTDLCDAAEAQDECERYLKEAMVDDASNFDAHRVTATFFKVVGDHHQAQAAARSGIRLLRQRYKKLGLSLQTDRSAYDEETAATTTSNGVTEKRRVMAHSGDIEMQDPVCGDSEEMDREAEMGTGLYEAQFELPDAELRVSFAKTLIDLLMLDEATEVLLGLIEEDEESVAVWHLLAVVCMLSGELEDALAHIAKAQQLMSSEDDFCVKKTLADLKGEVMQRVQQKDLTCLAGDV